MGRKLRSAFAGLALCLVAPAAGAQTAAPASDSAWRFSGTMRLRYEALTGQVRPGFNPRDDLVSLRTTLAAQYDRGPLRVGVEVYDSRAWDANRRTPVSSNDINTLEPVQAYVQLSGKSPTLGPVSVQAGRFLLNLGSRRLVAADDFRNTTNSYTGLRVDLAPASVKTTLIYVQPQLRLPDGLDDLLDNHQRLDRESRALELWGGIAAKPDMIAGATVEAAYFRLRERDRPGRPTRDRALHNISVRIIRDPAPGTVDFELEAIRQTGRISSGAGTNATPLKVRAAFVHADVGYSFQHAWKPRLSAEFDLATGDDAGASYGRFDTLFGTRRAELAPSGLYNIIGRANIATPGLRLEIAPSPRWDAFVVARKMWLEGRRDSFSTTGVVDPTGASSRFAGNQLEGRVRYWLAKDRLRLEFNGAWLDRGAFLKTAPNATPSGDETYGALSLQAQF